ncbi:MAG: 5-formyltetrahydrofolate cyclo-ligase [Clostridia bacterium]|nr:5-formyltetrahydrofolate cyclo-ligase [Clostridia bacterium]MDY5555140.1 5-formyltetrahydrofolate cyclo-ligase [Blautia sp.]
MDTKREIRKKVFSLRAECSEEEIDKMSREITEKVISLNVFKQAERILAYADYNHEVKTGYLIEEAWKAGKEVAVPKVVGKDMVFYKLTDFSQLEPGYYNIPEPASGEIIQWTDALMIMPGVAFDRRNHRVGYGGGFYDRYLEKHPDLKRIAVGFSFQVFPGVPTEPTDICPQILVTENEICYTDLKGVII